MLFLSFPKTCMKLDIALIIYSLVTFVLFASIGCRTVYFIVKYCDLDHGTLYFHRERRYEDNLVAMLECVHMSHSKGWSKNPMMQLKITALVSPELCVSVSSLHLSRDEQRFSFFV